MTSNRIQKLLFSEYSDLEDIVLVEGPFAETDREGNGIRQVQIGLTPTKLILASYFVEPVEVEELGDQWRPGRGKDPDIESFELISAYPVESVNLSIYRHRRRQTLKARFCNGKVVYYEIGGWQERKMLWSVWCERIKFLSPYESGTSVSETSVGSSSSGTSSLYIVRSSLSVNQTGKPTLWCHYACAETSFQPGSWADPHLYLGPKYYDKGVNSTSFPGGDMTGNSLQNRKVAVKTKTKHQSTGLLLSPGYEVMAAEAVEVWETGRSLGRRVRRRYAFMPCPYLLGGLGQFRFSKPLVYSIQKKKGSSLVNLLEATEDVRPPMSKGRLLRTVSCESLAVPAPPQDKFLQPTAQQGEVVFWTRYPEELLTWRLPQYRAQQRCLKTTRKRIDPHIFGIKEKKHTNKRKQHSKAGSSLSLRTKKTLGEVNISGGGGDAFPVHIYSSAKEEDEVGWLLPVSRFSSSNLAHQLTMVHKQLFLQTNTVDLARARQDMNSWRAATLRAMVFFSLRISCVVANHVLLEHDIKRRARVIAKFMSVAYKCHRLQSQMSAEAVLSGLHSPPIYRLRHTWAFVRRHHATNYRRFEDLSKRYFDCRDPLFQKTYDDTVRVPPFLPSLSLLVAVLLERLPDLPQVQSFRFASECSESCRQSRPSPRHSASGSVADSVQATVRRFLSVLQLHPDNKTSPKQPPHLSACQSESHLHSASRETLLEHLDRFFAPVSDAASRRVLQDLEYFLESHQAAATRYQIPINPRVRAFLLHSRHPDMRTLYRQSLLVEP